MIPSTGQLAQSVANAIDGDWNDGLSAYLTAVVKGGDLIVTATDEQTNETARYRATFERIN